ncbi:MAG: hypothetical protein LW875_09170 [Proteobacteria bacterium]|jgi:predicted esterase|nr:hypothetical protein [Pseudomonadota bacterium]
MAHPKISSAALLKTEVQVTLPLSYHHFNQGAGKPLLIFLHGYTDTAAGFLKRAFPHLDHKYEILAPNGLFPVPQKIAGGWRQSFAWYFAEFTKSSVLIHPDVSASALVKLIQDLGLEDREKVLLGFSQGGFFLPFLCRKLTRLKKMFAVGSAFRPEDYQTTLPVPLEAFHGTEDEIVPFEIARTSFQDLQPLNPQGRFFSFPGLGHSMNDEARALLFERIEDVFE